MRNRAADCSSALTQEEARGCLEHIKWPQRLKSAAEVLEVATQTLRHLPQLHQISTGGRFLKISFPLPLWLLPIIIASEIKESLPCFPLDIAWAKVGSKQCRKKLELQFFSFLFFLVLLYFMAADHHYRCSDGKKTTIWKFLCLLKSAGRLATTKPNFFQYAPIFNYFSCHLISLRGQFHDFSSITSKQRIRSVINTLPDRTVPWVWIRRDWSVGSCMSAPKIIFSLCALAASWYMLPSLHLISGALSHLSWTVKKKRRSSLQTIIKSIFLNAKHRYFWLLIILLNVLKVQTFSTFAQVSHSSQKVLNSPTREKKILKAKDIINK